MNEKNKDVIKFIMPNKIESNSEWRHDKKQLNMFNTIQKILPISESRLKLLLGFKYGGDRKKWVNFLKMLIDFKFLVENENVLDKTELFTKYVSALEKEIKDFEKEWGKKGIQP